MRRMCSVWLPNFPIRRQRPTSAPRHEPFALIASHAGLRQVVGIDEAAAAAGVRIGQKLAGAQAICPRLAVLEADPAGDLAALARLAQWAERYTPMAVADPPDGLWLDVTGCGHLWTDETGLAHDLQRRLAAPGLHHSEGLAVRIAVAGTTGAAWALARWHAARDTAPIVLPPDQDHAAERAALATLPVACLRLEERSIVALRRIGLKNVEDLLRLPRAELAAGFRAVLPRLDQALGQMEEAIIWPHPPSPWEERLAFAEPIGTPEDLRRALTLLVDRLCRRLEAERKGARHWQACFYRVDGHTPDIAITTSRPIRELRHLSRLLTDRLDQLDPGFGVEVVSLTASAVAPQSAPQQVLDAGTHQPGSGAGWGNLIDMLGNRLGSDRLWRSAPYGSHVPERAVQRVPPATANAPRWERDPAAPRPIRLLRRPEAIDVVAPLPDEPPLLFRWRRSLHRVRAAAGPERIAREWWRAAHPSEGLPPDGRDESDRLRDYYYVEDTAGARFWVFRVGLPGGGGNPPPWFLHGLFG